MEGKYQLKDTTGGFFDPVTKFQIVRDQIADVKEPIGDATRAVIQAGGLVKVEKGKAKDNQ